MSKKIKKVLIANRGEIALRIIRACKELGLETIAVHSEADTESLHVKLADESVCIGPPQAISSYLNKAQIISAAEVTNADAIHPGYGFLSENADFAKICEDCGITFIGPNSRIISQMGDKINARELAKRANVQMLPGSPSAISNTKELTEWANKIGFPVILKAAAGGGGRGIKIVYEQSELIPSFEKVQTEAKAAFGSSDIFIEKFLETPRHVEIQIMGDRHGNLIHLGERDCTIQRKNQKLLEESPSPPLTEQIRKQMGEAALRLAKEVSYDNVGTVEFLFDPKTNNFYFMEMNTRIQVEHPVTELVTGIDLVSEMIKISSGDPLRFEQKDIKLGGHAIECRINAEDPVNFRPSPGKIQALHLPGGPGVRVDSFIYDQYTVPPFYDSMIAKLIVHAETREAAIARMSRSLDEFIIEGISSNIDFHKKIMKNSRFISGDFDTSFLKNWS